MQLAVFFYNRYADYRKEARGVRAPLLGSSMELSKIITTINYDQIVDGPQQNSDRPMSLV